MRAAILDREEQNRLVIADIVRKQLHGWVLHDYDTPFELVTGVCDELKGNLELLLIHITSGDDENIAVARDLQRYFPHLRLIFYSGKNDCAEEIFNANPICFLRLPFRRERLEKALRDAQMMCEEVQGQSIAINAKGETQRLPYTAVRYVESVGRKLVYYTDLGSYTTYMLMSEALFKLPAQFVQCHRSYIVNIDRVSKFAADTLVLTTGEFVPISRSHSKEIRAMLKT